LLLEPQRTNLVANSEVTSGYSTFGSAFTQNTATSPQGYVNADTIAGDGSQVQIYASTPVTFASAGQVTMSLFVKANNANAVSILMDGFAGISSNTAIFNLATGTTASSGAKIENYGNGWYRCSFTATIDAGDLSGSFAFNVRPSLDTLIWPTAGDANGKSVFVWGFQAEAGAYATSYIPTLGTSVTRVADAGYKTGVSSLIGQTEGVLYAEVQNTSIGSTSGADNVVITIEGSSFNDVVGILYQPFGTIYGLTIVGGALQTLVTANVGTTSAFKKIAFAYKANDFALYVDGVQVGTDTSGTVPTCSNLGLGQYYNGGSLNVVNSKAVKQALVFKTRLTNAQLAELTTL
jgi:hypothetical protein